MLSAYHYCTILVKIIPQKLAIISIEVKTELFCNSE